MENTNLYNQEAKDKIKELAESIDFAMMATNLDSKPFHVIPMSTKKVDENGHIWFLSGKDSNHNADIKRDNKVMLIYSQPSNMSFFKVYGEAVLNYDKAVFEELYGKTDDMWFDGVDDPNVSAIQFKPIEAYYWEPKNNKFVTLLKMGVSAITGNEPDISDSGKIVL